MKLQTIVDIQPSSWQATMSTRWLMVGSCFSDEISRTMEQYYLPVAANPFGTLYNPLSIVQALQMTEVPPLIEHDGLWHSMAHHGAFSRPTKEETSEVVAQSIEMMQTALREADAIVITFGTAWVYEMNGAVVGNCHKLPEKSFTRRRLTVEEIVAAWQPILKRYPDKHWIFTVSPIRHIKDGLHENQLSKATLLQAVECLTAEGDPTAKRSYSETVLQAKPVYFPSFEIMLDELRDYRFYADDLVHPSAMAVKYIWERFSETYFSSRTRNELTLAHKRWKFEHHIALH